MAVKRKNYSAEFKAKVALEAIRGEATIAELVAKHGVHRMVIQCWKRQTLEGMAGIFSGKAEAKAAEKEGEIEKLHAKIGQIVVERDFLVSAPTPRRASRFRPADGSSSAPSPGWGDAADWPGTGRNPSPRPRRGSTSPTSALPPADSQGIAVFE